MARQNDLLMDISILYRSTQKYYDKKLANLSLTYAQLPILIAIYEEEGISMQKIALDGGYDKGTITKNVQKLVNLGYVIVQSSIKDKRAKELYTTDKTKEVMNQIYSIRRNWWKHIIQSIPSKKIEEFSYLYEDMAENAKVFADKDDEQVQFFDHQKVDLSFYTDKVSTVLSTAGCNFRCKHCTKRNLIFLNENRMELNLEDIKNFLEKRKDIYDAVCLKEPEPLMHEELAPFLRYVKKLGYLVKIQTNGSYPDRLKSWIDQKLIDFVSLDIKNAPSYYGETIGIPNFNTDIITKSIVILKKGQIDYDITITLIKELHDTNRLKEMAGWLKGVKQVTLMSNPSTMVENYHAFDQNEMNEALHIFKAVIPNIQIKGEAYVSGREA